MVIISTSATEVSIQAVSPELGVHFSSVLASQAGGGASAGAAAGAAGRPGGCRRLSVGGRAVKRRRRQRDAEDDTDGESQQPRTG